MSTPPSKDDSVVQTTQKQLEELDALIQKMLELPVSQLDEDPFKDMPIPAMPTAAPPALLRRGPERPSVSRPPLGPREETVTPPPAAASPTTPPQPENARTDESTPKNVNIETNKNREKLELQLNRPAEPPVEPKKPLAKLMGRLPRLPDDWHLLPLLWPNRAFDQLALRCGRPGMWLRSSKGRNLIGWGGIALALAAVAWAILDWIAWNW